jgi:nitrate/nitrite transporter NarK
MSSFIAFLTGYLLSQFFRAFLAVIAPELSAELSLSATGLGNISAAWFATFALSQFAVGAALDQFGPRRTVSISMLAGVVGSLLFAAAESEASAMLAMALIGIGCSATLMGPLYYFGRIYPFDRFALLASAIIGLGNIGNLVGGTPFAAAAEAFGWRAVFVVLAVVMLAAAGFIHAIVRDPPAAPHPAGGRESGHEALARIMAIRALWPIWPIMTIGYGILIAERGIWIGPYLSEVHGLGTIARGNVILLMAAAITMGALAYGPLERWAGTRKWLGVAGSATSATMFIILALLEQPSLSVATALLCLAGFTGMTYSVVMAHIRSFFPDHVLGRGITLANFFCMGGAGLVQTVSGRYVDWLRGSALMPDAIYSHLHLALGVSLLTVSIIYSSSREQR